MTTTNYNTEIYKRLLIDTLPGIIENEEENERAIEIVNSMMNKGEENLSPEEHRLMALLVRLIEDYEDKIYPISRAAAPAETLRILMIEQGLKQKDLVDIFGSQSIVSDILNGKREINKTHARRLADRFHIPVAVFV